MNLSEILDWFESKRNAENIAGKKRFGIEVSRCYGISNGDLRGVAKEIQRQYKAEKQSTHPLALTLWESGSNEARILACYLERGVEVTESQMESWVQDIQSWDVCDTAAGLFVKTAYSDQKIFAWAGAEPEFIKRMAFSMIAMSAVHQKKRGNAEMQVFFPLIQGASIDPRNFVKKAVNWALRQLGKRNTTLCKEATTIAKELMQSDDPAKSWIGKNAYKELTDPIQLTRIQKKGP